MAELLICVHDITHPDPYRDVSFLKRGDISITGDDGHVWGQSEKENSLWRILKWPSETRDSADSLLGSEHELNSRMNRIRAFYLSLDNLPADLAAYIADDDRTQPYFTMPATITIDSLKTLKPLLQDPNVIG